MRDLSLCSVVSSALSPEMVATTFTLSRVSLRTRDWNTRESSATAWLRASASDCPSPVARRYRASG